MALFLGIDGGGTGCRAAIADAQGRILGLGSAGPANVNTDIAATRHNVLQATAGALREAGLADSTMASLRATLGLAGANVTAAARALAASLPFAASQITTDAITAARGALGDSEGIVAAMGTGSVFAVQRGGTIRQYGGRGFVLGDEGSGAVLGRALLAEVLRAEDGFVTMTPLLHEILADFGGVEGIIAFGFRAKPGEFAALAPRLQGDDPAARRILRRATDELRAIITHLQSSGPLPVVFLGGLGPIYAARLGHLWQTRAPLGSGLDGAVRMALDMPVSTTGGR